MQTTLLGLALALIAAILAAFAAPLFIDWNEWRPQLEAQASALAGTRVTISGKIDLTLLPTPAFVLRNVSLGDAETGTGMRASEMRGSLSLPALLSGKVEADAFVISRPAIRIAIEKDGRLLLPAGASAGQEISVSGFVFEAGSLTIEDRRTNSLFAAEDFSARGELVSREGPFRLDGGFRLSGERWILRVSSGRFAAEHSGKVRLSLERPSDATVFEAEGVLSLAKASPRFDGTIVAAQTSGELPWRVAASVSGNASELTLGNLELSLGRGELPITLSGSGKITPYAHPKLALSLESKRIDLDLGDQKAAVTGAAHVLPLLGEIGKLLTGFPLDTQIVLQADGILAGGQMVRDVRAQLRAGNAIFSLEQLEAKLPGRAAITLAGNNDGGKFSGPLSFDSEEPQMFARWLLGEEIAGKLQAPPALNFKGIVSYAGDEVMLDKMQGVTGETRIDGRLLLQGIGAGQEPVLQADLQTERLNFDAVVPAVKGATGFLKDLKFTLNLYAKESTLLSKPLKIASIALTHLADGLQIKNVTLDDLAGLSLTASYAANGRIEFSGEAVRPSGFVSLLEYLSGSGDFAQIASKYAESYFPLRFGGGLTPSKDGWRGETKSGDAQISFDLGALRDARRTLQATFLLPDTELTAKGEIRFGKDGRFEPILALALKSADFRKASVLADRVAANVLPASGTASLYRDENRLVFDKLSFDLAGTRGHGSISFPLGEISPFAGNLSFDRMSVETLLSLVLGRAKVSYMELSVPLLANLPGRLKVEIGSLTVSERITLQKAAFEVRAGRVEVLFDDFQAELAGGKLSGSLRVADTYPRVLELKFDASALSLAQLVAAKSVRGTVRTSLALGANGNTQDELLASIAGQGSIGLSNFELDRTDATAVASVFAAFAKDTPDESKIEQALLAALDRGPLKISKLEAPLVIANGIFRSGSAKAKAGNTEIVLSGYLNIPKQSVEALLNIDVASDSAVRPGAILRWQGPLESPERKIDAKALITAITLRAIERGGQNSPNINLLQEERIVPAKKKKTPAKNDIEAAPLLPPPANIPAAPQPHSQN